MIICAMIDMMSTVCIVSLLYKLWVNIEIQLKEMLHESYQQFKKMCKSFICPGVSLFVVNQHRIIIHTYFC